MDSLAALAGGGGVLAALVAVIGYLLASNRQDRIQYEQAIDRAEKRADLAEQRAQEARRAADEAVNARYRCEETISELRSELAQLRRRDGSR